MLRYDITTAVTFHVKSRVFDRDEIFEGTLMQS